MGFGDRRFGEPGLSKALGEVGGPGAVQSVSAIRLLLDDQQAATRLEHPKAFGDSPVSVLPMVERMNRPDSVERLVGKGEVFGAGRDELDIAEAFGPPIGDRDHRVTAIHSHRTPNRCRRGADGRTRPAPDVEDGVRRVEVGDRGHDPVRLGIASEQ